MFKLNVLHKLINIHYYRMLSQLINIHRQLKQIDVLNRIEQIELYYLIKKLITSNQLPNAGSNLHKIVIRIIQDDDDLYYSFTKMNMNYILRVYRWYDLQSKLYPINVINALCNCRNNDISYNYLITQLDFLFNKVPNNKKFDWKGNAGYHNFHEYFSGARLNTEEIVLVNEMRNILRLV